MTEATLTGGAGAIDLSSEAARRRVRRRYRAEARFRAYGIAALVFAFAFLVILIADIVTKALPAVTATSVDLTVTLDRQSIDPQGSNDPRTIAAGDFMAPIQAAFLAEFPEAAGDRRARQALYGLISSGASDELRRRVLADPALIGQTVTFAALFSDDADLFFKDRVTEVRTSAGVGLATPAETDGVVTVLSSANDFAGALVEVKRSLSFEARELRDEIARYEELAETTAAERTAVEADLAAARVNAPDRVATLEGQLARLDADLQSIAGQIDGLTARAAELEARYTTAGAPETLGPEVPSLLVAINGGIVKVAELANDRVSGEALTPLVSYDAAAPGAWNVLNFATPEGDRKLTDREIVWLLQFGEAGAVTTGLNWGFFGSGDSREAELAGILGALVGSALTMLVTLVVCLPIGLSAAIYLEEFAPKNRLTDVIEVNINNLAAVPSIIFGLLGLAVFLNFFGLPRSTPLVGGLVLALLVLPTIIIASRAALKAVPPSIREAALGVGASHQQAVFHHVLPVAMPGVLTGTIIGMAHALGETAPLLLIGMIAFIVDVPQGVTSASTVLPVQIFLWSDLPEIGFQAKTSLAILVLLAFLLLMNGAAILLRRRFERRW
jgi:phosphate transport system permease protein